MPKIKQLVVDTPQGVAGLLDKEARFVFNYSLAAGDQDREIALGMPIRAESYASSTLLPIFAMNRPEGFLRDIITRRLSKSETLDDMRMLSIVGENQIGRLSYHLPDSERKRPKAQMSREDLLTKSPSQELFEYLVETYFESGISGVQPKVLVAESGKDSLTKMSAIQQNLIVKAAGDDYPHLTQNEYLCMEAARIAGLEVAPFWLSDDGGLFIMERFDLEGEKRLGFEDMTVLMNLQPDTIGHYKYTQSYEAIGRFIQAVCRNGEGLASRQRFFEYVALSVMVRNGDAHLKNFGLTYESPGGASTRLSPLYDVVTTSVYPTTSSKSGLPQVDDTLAIKMRGSKTYPSRDALIRFGMDACGVAQPGPVLDRLADAMSQSVARHGERVDAKFLGKLVAQWDEGRFAVASSRVYAIRQSEQAAESEEPSNGIPKG